MSTVKGFWAAGYALQHDWWGGSKWVQDPTQATPVTQSMVVVDGVEEFSYDPPRPKSDELGKAWFVSQLPKVVGDDLLATPSSDWGRCVVAPTTYRQSEARRLTAAGEPQRGAVVEDGKILTPVATGYV